MTVQLDLEEWGIKWDIRKKPYSVSLEFIEETCERQPLINRLCRDDGGPDFFEFNTIWEKLEETRVWGWKTTKVRFDIPPGKRKRRSFRGR